MNIRHEIKELNNKIDELGGAPGLSNTVKELQARVHSNEQDVSGVKNALADILDRLDKLDKKKAPAKKATKAKKAEAEEK